MKVHTEEKVVLELFKGINVRLATRCHMEITRQARDEISKFNQLQASALARTGTYNQLTYYNQPTT